MNKKFLSAILFGALMVTSTGTFVSCKDYDDDIDGLQTQVDANKADCAAGIQALQGQVAALQSALATAQSTADAAKKAAADAQNAADAAKKAAEAAAAQAKADAIAKAIEEVEALKAWVEGQNYVTNEDLAAALLPVSAKIAAIEETLDQITVYITETLEANIQTALKNIMTLQEDLAIQQAVLEEYEALMEELKAGDEELWAELTSTREELQEAISALNLLLEDATDELWAEIQLVKNELYGAITNLANLQADDKAELMNEINEILKANQTTSDILNALINTQADDKAELKNEIEQILIENAKLSETLAALITIHGEDKAALEAAVAELSKTLEEKIKAFEAKLGDADTTYGEEINKLWNEINLLVNQNVETSNTIASLITLLGDMEEAHAADIATLKGELSKLIADQIAALNTALELQFEEVWAEIAANNSTLGSAITSVQNQIFDLQGELATLHILVKTRLTSLLFAPTTYVDGIEAIPFITLQYLPWGDLTANTAETSYTTALPAKVAISDNSTEAYYFVSPSNVDLTSIAKLNVLVQKDAQNITSRAASAEIEATMGGVVDGKMKVNLKKNATASFGGKGNKFSIMALQAELTKEEDETTATLVTSDWARIYESHVRPFIHNAEADVENAASSHFYTYAQIHSNGGSVVPKDDICDTDGQFIAKELVYNVPTDLLSFVNVCDKDGNTIAYKDYNMAFEFALMTYNLQDAVEGKTDQAKFAKIEGTTITSQSYNGIENNADAIGREPMIQAVLKDMTNNEVVDVRYFKVKWIAKDEQASLGELEHFENDFDCNATFGGTIGTEVVNVKIYTKLNVSKEYFHANYEHSTNLYASLADLKAGQADATLGTFERILATGSTTTYNYKWTYTTDITEAEYDAAKKVVTAYGYFYNKHNPAEKHFFSLSDEITIPQMGITGYVASQWNKTPVAMDGTKSFQVNPALTTDNTYGITHFFDCQLISSMLRGYNNSTIAPAHLTIDDITNDVTNTTWFVFDASRIAQVLGNGWSVSTDGTQLMKGTEIAAVIEDEVNIRLYENPVPTVTDHGVPTEAAQELLDKVVPVKLMGANCAGIEKVLDMYLVHFIDPLKMVIDQKDTVLKDLITGGSSVDVSKAVQIFEKFGLKRGVVYLDANNNIVKDNQLVQWYNVQTVTWDIANAKTNLKLDGHNLVIDGQNITHDWSDCSNHYQLSIDPTATTLTFHNNSGSHIQQEIKVAVPVYVQTKWNPALADPTSATVILTIKPGDYE